MPYAGDTCGTERESTVITEGGEVHFRNGEECFVADRIEILPNGWVRAISKSAYQQELYPPDLVERVATHTADLEEEEWW